MKKIIDVAKAQNQLTFMIVAQTKVKEYEANWLTNVKTVTRDASGRFASVGQVIKEATEDPQETRRKVSSELLKFTAKGLDKLVSKHPKFVNTLLEKMFGVDAEKARDKLADMYAEVNPGLPNAIKPDPLKEIGLDIKGRDPKELAKDLSRAFELAGYKYNKLIDDLNHVESESEAINLLGKIAATSIPIAAYLAATLTPEIAIGMLVGDTLGSILASAAATQAVSFAANKAMDKADVKNPLFRLGVDLAIGIGVGGAVTGASKQLQKKAMMKAIEAKRLEEIYEAEAKAAKEVAEKMAVEKAAEKAIAERAAEEAKKELDELTKKINEAQQGAIKREADFISNLRKTAYDDIDYYSESLYFDTKKLRGAFIKNEAINNKISEIIKNNHIQNILNNTANKAIEKGIDPEIAKEVISEGIEKDLRTYVENSVTDLIEKNLKKTVKDSYINTFEEALKSVVAKGDAGKKDLLSLQKKVLGLTRNAYDNAIEQATERLNGSASFQLVKETLDEVDVNKITKKINMPDLTIERSLKKASWLTDLKSKQKFTNEVVSEFTKNNDLNAVEKALLKEKSTLPDSGGDGILELIVKRKGFDGLPKTLEKQELDKLIASGEEELFRGVVDDANDTYKKQFVQGKYFGGWGVYGNGTYTAVQKTGSGDAKNIAQEYANNGKLLRMSIDKNAKIVDYENLMEAMGNMEKQGVDIPSELKDPGRFAALLGYGGIRKVLFGSDYATRHEYLCVLDRTALRVDKNYY